VERFIKLIKSEKNISLILSEMLKIEQEINNISEDKEFSPPANFDLMFKIGVYGPLIASLHFQIFLALFKVFFKFSHVIFPRK